MNGRRDPMEELRKLSRRQKAELEARAERGRVAQARATPEREAAEARLSPRVRWMLREMEAARDSAEPGWDDEQAQR